MDYGQRTLTLKLSKPVTSKWREALYNMGGFSAIWGKAPENFSFTGDTARIAAEEREVQDITAIPGQKSASIMLDQWNCGTMPLSLPVKARVIGG